MKEALTKPTTLPPRQAQLLAFINERLAAGKRFPTHQEMADIMGWKNVGSVSDCLMRLWWAGAIPVEWTTAKGKSDAYWAARKAIEAKRKAQS